jgi:hypothetical protein
MAWLPEASALTVVAGLRALMPAFDFAACVPFGRERGGVLFRAASQEAPPPDVVDRIESLLGLNTPDALRYADRRRQQRRTARLVPTRAEVGEATMLEAFLLAGDTSAEGWIRTLLQDQLPAGRYGRLLLMPGAAAPVAVVAKSPQVCNCFNVGEDAIRSALQRCGGNDDERLAGLQGQLPCGTQLRLLPARAAAAGQGRAGVHGRHITQVINLADNRVPWASASTSRRSAGARTAPIAHPRAGRRPARPGAGRHRDRSGGRRFLPGHAHQGRDARRNGRLPRRHPRPPASPAGQRSATVVLPSYNGARKLPVLTPLLALLLAREGAAVLVHGTATEDKRVTSEAVFAALGQPARSAISPLRQGECAFVPPTCCTRSQAPAGRAPRGRPAQSGHSLVKLMNPCEGPR